MMEILRLIIFNHDPRDGIFVPYCDKVFDGHGGTDAATYFRQNILKFIVEDSQFPVCLEKAIQNAFLKVHHAFADNTSLDISSGTTALTALVFESAYRSPLCKSKRGGLKDTYPDDILAPIFKALMEKTNLNPAEVGDIVVGSLLGAGSLICKELYHGCWYG